MIAGAWVVIGVALVAGRFRECSGGTCGADRVVARIGKLERGRDRVGH